MEKEKDLKVKADKSLYVCFGEYQLEGTVSYVFKDFNFSHDYTRCSVSHLFKISGKDIPAHMGCYFLFSPLGGSHFILAGGVWGRYCKAQGKFLPAPCKQICIFDSDGKKRQPQMVPDFNYGKSQPLLWFLGEELYALAQMPNRCTGDPTSFFKASSFEVFDFKKGEKGKWSTLPDPPCYKYYTQVEWNTNPFSYAIAGSTLFVTATYCPTFRINLADPTNRLWTEVGTPPPRHLPSSSSGSGDSLPIEFDGKTLVVDAGEDNGFLFFSYNALDELGDPNHISVHLLSYQCDSIIGLNSVSLPEEKDPEWCFDFLPPENYSFVDIGDCEACLLLSGRVTYEVERMQIRVIPFEFKLVKGNSLPSVEVKFRPIQTIVHQTDRYIGDMQMVAAFRGPPSQTPRE